VKPRRVPSDREVGVDPPARALKGRVRLREARSASTEAGQGCEEEDRTAAETACRERSTSAGATPHTSTSGSPRNPTRVGPAPARVSTRERDPDSRGVDWEP